MIRLAVAVGFLAVFGLVSVVIIYLMNKSSKKQEQDVNSKPKKNVK